MQSERRSETPPRPSEPGGPHVAIIMDGNGRWAEEQGLPREAGHLAGAAAVRRAVRAARALSVEVLSLFAFSCDNWLRPVREVSQLMEVIEDYLRSEALACAGTGVRIQVIGRRDRIPARLFAAVQAAERVTVEADRMLLQIAVDYSSRDAILRAVQRAAVAARRPPGELGSLEDFEAALAEASHAGTAGRGVDLLIRTGGERRLSDFLLWECAYAELVFLDKPWPCFGPADLEGALRDFAGRDRRFGGLPELRRERRRNPVD